MTLPRRSSASVPGAQASPARSSATTTCTTTTTRTCPARAARHWARSARGSSCRRALRHRDDATVSSTTAHGASCSCPSPTSTCRRRSRTARAGSPTARFPAATTTTGPTTVSNNTFTHNGFFGNPTNGDAGEISDQHTPGNCWFGNTNTNGTPITSEPPDIQSTHGTCGVPNQGAAPTSTLALQLICANQLLGPCPPAPGMVYPRTTRHRDAAASARPALHAQPLPRSAGERILRAEHAAAQLHGLSNPARLLQRAFNGPDYPRGSLQFDAVLKTFAEGAAC